MTTAHTQQALLVVAMLPCGVLASTSGLKLAIRAELLLITLLGPDRPGLMAALAALLAEHELDVLDIGQSVTHSFLSLSLLVLSSSTTQAHMMRNVMLWGEQNNLSVRFRRVSKADYQQWVERQGRDRHIITMLSPRIEAGQLQFVTRICAEHDMTIDNITRLSGRQMLKEDGQPDSVSSCVELSVRGVTNREKLHSELLLSASEQHMDISVQQDDIYRRNRRLLVLDMDSTLISTEVIDRLADEAGVGEHVRTLTASAMCGEIDFAESLRQRVKLLAGLSESAMARVAEQLPLTEGAEHLLATLKRLGLQTAIISGGFRYFGERLAERLQIDHLYANDLKIHKGKLTGELQGAIVDAETKAALLEQLADKLGLHLQQVIAVGDGANDLKMLGRAGLGIAFRAKPLVRQSAKTTIATSSIDSILYLMGLRASDQIALPEYASA